MTDVLTTIRTLDGPALTAMAFSLDLAPWGTQRWRGGFTRAADLPAWVETADTIPWWEPHEDLPQALALLHRLEAEGWTTSRVWDAPQQHGVYQVYKGELQARGDWGQPYRYREMITRHADASEALACLRCCVLAVAQEKRGG